MQTAMTFPDWVAALDKMLPKLASAIRYALAAASTEADRYQAAGSQKGKPAGKAAATAKRTDPKVSLILPTANCTPLLLLTPASAPC